ncbi:MAG: bifunctional pyr operon transcriptional regulator/uracil phosphoribosyltransferase PyrR [Flavobacteriales bacterium]|nr:bifunctional pyr operon transcriptional regulator/uracil phosphoribosyltransferase PyrR [Flavobacteriales bacterium]
MLKRLLIESTQLEFVLHRMAMELYENHTLFEHSAIIGLQPRGSALARKIRQILTDDFGIKNIRYGELDSTFYRDDFRRSEKILLPNTMEIEFSIEGLHIILVDDVLYTGRSVRAALNALSDFGRPAKTELLTLIDRRFKRELPIQPDYVGLNVDSRANDKVIVDLVNEQKVWIETEKK